MTDRMNLYNAFEDEELDLPQDVPVFPLPGTVLLPGEPMPLHIFEDRYKLMTETALASERLIVMGHEKAEHPDRSRVYTVAGLGRIAMEERLEGGQFNLLVVGVRRIRIGSFVQDKPYKRARVEVLEDRFSQTASTLISALEAEILDLARKVLVPARTPDPSQAELAHDLSRLPPGEVPLGTLTDYVASALFLPPMEKQMILEATDVTQRAEKLIFLLKYQFHSQRSGLPSTLQ